MLQQGLLDARGRECRRLPRPLRHHQSQPTRCRAHHRRPAPRPGTSRRRTTSGQGCRRPEHSAPQGKRTSRDRYLIHGPGSEPGPSDLHVCTFTVPAIRRDRQVRISPGPEGPSAPWEPKQLCRRADGTVETPRRAGAVGPSAPLRSPRSAGTNCARCELEDAMQRRCTSDPSLVKSRNSEPRNTR